MRLIKQICCTKKESLNLCVASACTHEEDEIFALYGTYGDPKLLIQNFKCVDKSFSPPGCHFPARLSFPRPAVYG